MGIFKKGKLEIENNALDVIQASAFSTAGYFVGKNNKKHIEDILKWYDVFKTLEDEDSMKIVIDEGMKELAGLISEDKFIQLQVINALHLVNIDINNPTVDFNIDKYMSMIDSFMSGVMASK